MRVRVLGDLTLLNPDLRSVIAKVVKATRDFENGPTLNICFAYTSRHEMARAMGNIARMCEKGELDSKDVDHDVFRQCLYTGFASGGNWEISDPDILIRTSGERRLSDFLLWQSSNSFLAFRKVMWPEFSAFDLISVLLDYRDWVKLQRSQVGNRSTEYGKKQRNALLLLKKDL